MKILLVEDNEAIILGLEYLLTQEGFQFFAAKTVAQAQKAWLSKEPDLVLLDISLPDGDGFSLYSELRKKKDIPVIFLTAREEERDVVKGFDLGADDYIVKPFRNRELISRIRNVLRRNKKDTVVLNNHFIKMDIRAGKVFVGEQEVQLTRLEFKILHILMAHQGRVFTREEILSNIWDISGNFVNDNTLSVTMKRIREKIGDKDGAIIRTVRGIGYRMDKE